MAIHLTEFLAAAILAASPLTSQAAEHAGSSASHSAQPSPGPTASAENTPADTERDLTLGKSASENLAFKAMSEYEQRQSAEAIKKLEKFQELHGGTNEFEKIRLIREILTSDATKEIKEDVRRLARLELAGIAERSGYPNQALQYLAEYIELFPKDHIVPEVLLRQGYLMLKMGAQEQAINKFYLALTAASRIPGGSLTYNQRVTLTAKSEIADARFNQGKFKEAANLYSALLNEPSDELNRLVVKTKLIRSLSKSENLEGTIKHSLEFLEKHGASEYQAEMRYLLASAYKSLGQKQESLRELMRLLEAVEVAPLNMATRWRSWKMVAGNEIGNQLFLEGDYPNAVQVYTGLVGLDTTPGWQMPIYYQVGLCYEKLMQPTEATRAYGEIVTLAGKGATKLPEGLQIIVDMAKFRIEVITWRQSLEPSSPAAETKVAERTN